MVPLMQMHEGRLVTSVDPARLGPHPKSGKGKVPELTSEQEDALEALTASAHRNQIAVNLQKGDMLFLNNLAIVHCRDKYEDAEDTSRHLVRLWLHNSELGWDIPSSMKVPWKAAFEADVKKVFNYEPAKEYTRPEFTAGSAAFVIEGTKE